MVDHSIEVRLGHRKTDPAKTKMFGPYTPTLLALLTKHGKLTMPTIQPPLLNAPNTYHKVAVVTGAASGIGAALAKTCADQGMHLVLADNAWMSPGENGAPMDNPYNHPLVQELTQHHKDQRVTALHTDVGKKSELQTLHDTAVAQHGEVHYLFNNAGTGMPGVLSATDESMKRAFDINFWSVMHGMRLFVPTMELNKETSFIVNTSSLAGLSEACGLYGVTKHAVVAATEAVASELAWRESNVHVSVLCPSYVNSNVGQTTQRAGMATIHDATTATAASTASTATSESKPSSEMESEAKTQLELENIMSGLSVLIEGGMDPMDVARLTLDGLAQRHKYHYTNVDHATAALDDRIEQIRANGMTTTFQRRMEQVVSTSMGGAGQSRTMSTTTATTTAVPPPGMVPGMVPDYYRLKEDHDFVTELLRNVVGGTDRLSFNSGIIQNHRSLEEGYHGWNPPDAVAFATSTAEVSALMQVCHAHRVPVVSYGTGTSVEGG